MRHKAYRRWMIDRKRVREFARALMAWGIAPSRAVPVSARPRKGANS